jgi:DNA-3-methyladenine glycosylase II
MPTRNMHPYVAHLSKDKRFRKIIEERGEIKLHKRRNIPLRLCASIMSQQLSVKVAAVIYRRFLDLYGKNEPTPTQIFDTPHETLRSIGLSNAKANYVKNVAHFAMNNDMSDKMLASMSDEEIIQYLVPIKGVGRWTVEMLLIFTLAREDVFAPDDLGIQNFMLKHYRVDNTNKKAFKESMVRISRRWSPYRSFACLHMWGAAG